VQVAIIIAQFVLEIPRMNVLFAEVDISTTIIALVLINAQLLLRQIVPTLMIARQYVQQIFTGITMGHVQRAVMPH